MEKKPKITPTEKREHYNAGKFSVREAEDKGKVIEGVAIVTEQETVLWEGSDYREIEVIAQSCIAPDFIAKQDMAINLLHNRDESFARTPNSLRVESREDGLHFEADVPDCDLGKRAQALTENGTYQGCSFEFYPKDYEVSERKAADGKTEYVIRHTAYQIIGPGDPFICKFQSVSRRLSVCLFLDEELKLRSHRFRFLFLFIKNGRSAR